MFLITNYLNTNNQIIINNTDIGTPFGLFQAKKVIFFPFLGLFSLLLLLLISKIFLSMKLLLYNTRPTTSNRFPNERTISHTLLFLCGIFIRDPLHDTLMNVFINQNL